MYFDEAVNVLGNGTSVVLISPEDAYYPMKVQL